MDMDTSGFGGNKQYGEIEEIIDDVERRFSLLNNFEILNNPPFDHHFTQYYQHRKHVQLGATLAQKIEREWRLLETNLHSSIVVRAYQTRVDLMRAAVIGLPGTPYYQALFFFDIFFPPNYPVCPPKLYYHSYGLRLNPSLHPQGKVSLSLLENWFERLIHRWFGCEKEKWNPKQSTILDVLVSIQESVLNSNPYHSVACNKDVFLLTCDGMIRTLEAPLMDFEDFVAGHFRTKAHTILYNYQGDKGSREFLKLLKAFEANGTYCQHHLHREIIEKEPASSGEGRKRANEKEKQRRFSILW